MTDEQKEIVRIEAFWIDAWIKCTTRASRPLHRPRRRGPRSGRAYLLPHARIGRHARSAPPTSWPTKSSTPVIRPTSGTSTLSTSPTATTGATTCPHCIQFLQDTLLPETEPFGYGQVESPYGSGEFYEYITELLEKKDNVVARRIPDREAILGSIKEFLSTGK